MGEVCGLAVGRVKEAWGSEETLILNVRPAGALERPGAGLTFRAADRSDGPRYARDIGTDSSLSFRSRLGPDVHCYLVEAGGRLLHATWVTTTAAWTREIGRYLAPPPGDAYVYESFTRADARGRGIYPFALAGIVSHLGASGTARVWVGVESHNAPSRRAIAKGGFSEAFELTYRRRLGRLSIDPPSGPMADIGHAFLGRL